MNLILDKREFTIGIILLILFIIPLILLTTPVFNGKSGLKTADALFNSLAKDSSYYIPQARDKAESMQGERVNIKVSVDKADQNGLLAKMLRDAGAEVTGDAGELSVQGDLGKIMGAATVDADNLFKEQGEKIKNRYGTDNPRLALYLWHNFFSQAEKKYIRKNMSDRALTTHSIMYRALEPAYNFAGIEAAPISERLGITIFLLVFYVVYTIWFGFAFLFVFEGIGIKATAQH
ncbi:MAG: hypothetical protein ACQES5_05675 [Thermodesulfobacteriota bacterium]